MAHELCELKHLNDEQMSGLVNKLILTTRPVFDQIDEALVQEKFCDSNISAVAVNFAIANILTAIDYSMNELGITKDKIVAQILLCIIRAAGASKFSDLILRMEAEESIKH